MRIIVNIFFKTKRLIRTFFIKRSFRQVGKNLQIYGKAPLSIWGGGNIYVGNNVRLNEFIYINARSKSKIIIGNDVTISPFAKILTATYDINLLLAGKRNKLKDIHSDKDIFIGNKCWIGLSAIILPGVELKGENIIIGAGSVVTKSINDSNVLVAGNPAKIVKKY